MKFDCGPTPGERRFSKQAALRFWHPWFAWKPIRVGSNECYWLETIERKGTLFYVRFEERWLWDYRCPMYTEAVLGMVLENLSRDQASSRMRLMAPGRWPLSIGNAGADRATRCTIH